VPEGPQDGKSLITNKHSVLITNGVNYLTCRATICIFVCLDLHLCLFAHKSLGGFSDNGHNQCTMLFSCLEFRAPSCTFACEHSPAAPRKICLRRSAPQVGTLCAKFKKRRTLILSIGRRSRDRAACSAKGAQLTASCICLCRNKGCAGSLVLL
jgi:hypothetical protein